MLRLLINKKLDKITSRFYGKDIKFGTNVKYLMLQGVHVVADAVSVTLGPKGRHVIVEQKNGSPIITKDGFTIAKAIELPDKFQNIGASLLIDVAKKTNEAVGDGTTTACLLARGIAKQGFEKIKHGANPIEIRTGIMKAIDNVQEYLTMMSKSVNTFQEIEMVASMAANRDENVANLIATAINTVGHKGVVTVKCGKSLEDQIEIKDGMKIERGYMSPYFINSSKGSRVEYNDALILLSQKKIFTVQELIPALEISTAHKKPLVIITEDIDEDPLSLLIVNKVKYGLPVVCVKAPGFGEYRKKTLTDIAIAVGGVVFEDDTNLISLRDCMYESLGKVAEVTITKDSTMLIRGNGDELEIKDRIKEIKSELERTSLEFDRLKLLDRLVRMQSKVVLLHIGGRTEVEINEKKDRVDDALHTTRAAMEEGIVPGCGMALLRCIPILDLLKPSNKDQATGIDIVRHILTIPTTTIAENAGHNGGMIVAKTPNYMVKYGYDVLSDSFVEMWEYGIMDSTKVLRQAILGAGRIASLLTTAEAVICGSIKEKPKRKI